MRFLSGSYLLIRPILFRLSAEKAHKIGMIGVRIIGFLHRLDVWRRPRWASANQVTTPFGILDSPWDRLPASIKTEQPSGVGKLLAFLLLNWGQSHQNPKPEILIHVFSVTPGY